MTSDSTISVRVDPTNPGQFFACCGLLELADRLWLGAEGWFDEDVFLMRTTVQLSELLRVLAKVRCKELISLDSGLPVKPLIAPLRIWISEDRTPITLDFWMRIAVAKGKIAALANPPWNLWSGKQTPKRIWTALAKALHQQITALPEIGEDLFDQRIPLSGRFGFDPAAAWNALDEGFSLNDQEIPIDSSPATEMLAAIGIQRCRSQVQPDHEIFLYSTWSIPSSPPLAAAASTGSFGRITTFRGTIVNRGSYAALGYSTKWRGPNERCY